MTQPDEAGARYVTLLDRVAPPAGLAGVAFESAGRSVLLTYPDWQRLGSPTQITMTVQPGDTINPEPQE